MPHSSSHNIAFVFCVYVIAWLKREVLPSTKIYEHVQLL